MKRILALLFLIFIMRGASAKPPPVQRLVYLPGAPHKLLHYDRDVRPILTENCFPCHGFDSEKRYAGLRLDVPAISLEPLPSGMTAIVPFNLLESEMAQRVAGQGQMRMPPIESGKHLTPSQIATIREWIAQGARYEPHWAFVVPKASPLPPVKQQGWARNPIDRFVLGRLEKNGLKPSPEASRRTLIRRVTFDLTGLPPTSAETEVFLQDINPQAYEHMVDRLLASPHYGERMASPWLDLSRYADTNGYHIDNERFMWRWRDWVIEAFNNNLPYDKFTLYQIAGDLLPHPTLHQLIATGFNRNNAITFEGGAIAAEYAANYVEDRVDTTATTFLALTVRCGQCHDHKFDPISHEDYYRFFAFFNNIPENGLDGQGGNAAPFMKAPTKKQSVLMAGYVNQIATLQKQLDARAAVAVPQEASWEKTASSQINALPALKKGLTVHFPLNENSGSVLHEADGITNTADIKGKPQWTEGRYQPALLLDGKSYADCGKIVDFERTDHFSYGAWIYPTAGDGTAVSKMDDARSFQGFDIFLSGGKVMIHIIHQFPDNALKIEAKDPIPLNKWSHIFVTYDGSSKAEGIQLYLNGKALPVNIDNNSLTQSIRNSQPFRIGMRSGSSPFQGRIQDVRVYNRTLSAKEVELIANVDDLRHDLSIPSEKRKPDQQNKISSFYLSNYDKLYQQLAAIQSPWRMKRDALDQQIPTTMIMQEMPKIRATHILLRGQYDHPGAVVTANTPGFLPPIPPGLPHNRLGLAEWMIARNNPLTARVEVNRLWDMLFGMGICKTVENFGMQSDYPSHPRLLDWLAVSFENSGWNIKQLLKLIVTSATYMQSSRATPAMLLKDPENRLLERGARFRLSAEEIRDEALSISGLINLQIGGPSVKPYQPKGIWSEIAFGGGFSAQSYKQDHGAALYRRSLYTFWKRSVPPPVLALYDAPDRNSCTVKRSVTNTPLQALAQMNDTAMLEASRKFAERMILDGGASSRSRLQFAFLLAVSRFPKPQENSILLGLYNQELTYYKAHPDIALKLVSIGESPRDSNLDVPTLAAWTTVASTILNMDETLTKE